MWNFQNYPPPYGYAPPPQPYPPSFQPPTPDDFQRGLKLALKLREREEKKEFKKKDMEAKKKADDKKANDAASQRTLTSIEWFIIGIILSPFVGPLYTYALNHAQGLVK